MKKLTWARPAGTPDMHAVYLVADSVAVAVCDETWISADTVEVSGAPPFEHRCDDCTRVLVDRRCVELGLAELVRNAP